MRTVIENAHIVSPGESYEGHIVLEDGKITHISQGCDGTAYPEDSDTLHVDAKGNYVAPGFIDIHTHGADGGRFYEGGIEESVIALKAKIREGVTTTLPTTMTQSPEGLVGAFEQTAEAADQMKEKINTPGIHIEGPGLCKEQIGAQNPEYLRMLGVKELQILQAIKPIVTVSVAPELDRSINKDATLDGSIALMRYLYENGIRTSFAHTSATEDHVRAVMDRLPDDFIAHLTHTGNAQTQLTKRDTGVVGSALDPYYEGRIIPELIGDGVHLSPSFMRILMNYCEPIFITDSIQASHRPVGEEYDLAGKGLIVSKDEKGYSQARLTDGSNSLAGSVARYPEVLKRSMEMIGKPIEDIIGATSYNQARSFGWEGKGTVEKGKDADLVILDKETLEPTHTIFNGKVVYEADKDVA